MADSVKRLAVLGSTGSIGEQTLDIVRAFPDRFRVIALAAGNNTALLTAQIDEFKPRFVYLQDKEKLLHYFISALYRCLSLEDIASHAEVDTVVIATSGKAGLLPTLAAVRAGKKVALANKEPLVMAGGILADEAKNLISR